MVAYIVGYLEKFYFCPTCRSGHGKGLRYLTGDLLTDEIPAKRGAFRYF